MIVIGLYGSANTGKTRTLRLLISQLINEGWSVVEPEDLHATVDIQCCLEAPNKKLICITTAGDFGESQRENKMFVARQKGVAVWITASRNSGGSVDEIWKNSSSTFLVDEVIWVHKIACDQIYKQFKGNWKDYSRVEGDLVESSDNDVCNMYDVQRLARLIQRYI